MRFHDQTIRDVITPHLGSSGEVRLRLTNRYNTAPVTFAKVTLSLSSANAGVVAPKTITFAGQPGVTAPAGKDVVSDPVPLSFEAFQPLAVSLYVPSSAGPLTKHWNSNATTFITPDGSGDEAAATSGSAFTQKIYSWLGVAGLDVRAGSQTRSIVAFGDSITDGWVGASATETKLDLAVNDKNLRYPDAMQRRIDDQHLPIAVVNAGIGGNQVVTPGAGPTGPSAVDRFATDVAAVPGVRGVIVFEGINDLGLSRTPASKLIEGLGQVIAQARAAKLKVWLATITPASSSKVDGTSTAPQSEHDRQIVNEWIRTKAPDDGYFDFDKAVRDPANPATLAPQYASADHLHLSPAGYEKIAATVDLADLAGATC
jgi:lysophospholipase L1-like esterase